MTLLAMERKAANIEGTDGHSIVEFLPVMSLRWKLGLSLANEIVEYSD
jgi:hypothetical protein